MKSKKSFVSLKSKIIYPILIIQLLSILYLGSTSLFVLVKEKKASLDNEMRKTCTNSEYIISEKLESIFTDLEKIGIDGCVEKYLFSYSSKDIEIFFLKRELFSELSYINADGMEEIKVIKGSISQNYLSYVSDSRFKELSSGNDSDIKYKFDDVLSDEGIPHVRILLKIEDAFEDCIGFVQGIIPFTAVAESVIQEKIGDSGFLYIVKKDGSVLYKNSLEDLFHEKSNQGISKFNLEKETLINDQFLKTKINDIECYAYTRDLEKADWSLLTLLPYTEFIKPVRKILNMTLPVIIFLISLSVIIVFRIAFSFTKRISTIGYETSNVAKGDLTSFIPDAKRDEVGMLSENFNILVKDLNKMISKIKEDVLLNLKIKETLDSNTEKTLASVTEIADSAVNMKLRMNSLDNDILNVKDLSCQIFSNMEDLDIQIDNQTSAVEESSASVVEMVSSINSIAGVSKKVKKSTDKLMENAETGEIKLQATKEAFGIASKNIDSIIELTDIISDIAEQTNLLSMNAAIEAAHAGDAGKGFAVVANEIKELANSSTKNIKNITEVITNVVTSIKTANDNVNTTGTAFSEIRKEIDQLKVAQDENLFRTEELSVGSEQILQGITMLKNVSENIRSASRIIKNHSSDVNESVENTKIVSADLSKGMEGISTGSNEIREAMDFLINVANNLQESTEELKAEIDKFKTLNNAEN